MTRRWRLASQTLRASLSVRAAMRRVDGVEAVPNVIAAKLCRECSRGRTPSPRRLQVEPSRDAEILTACRAAWDGPGATNALAVAATAAQTISRMIVVSARRDHSRIEPKCTARCNSLPFAALQLQPARIRTPRRVNTSRSIHLIRMIFRLSKKFLISESMQKSD